MQIVNCYVNLAGDRNNVVHKRNATVAEVMILRQIHGGEAVTDVKPVRNDRRAHATEIERLRGIYNRRGSVVDQVFPGANPKLPTNLKDLGLEPAQLSADADGSDSAGQESDESDEQG
jgi:hypothetical protein